jgi:hypothetical protein
MIMAIIEFTLCTDLGTLLLPAGSAVRTACQTFSLAATLCGYSHEPIVEAPINDAPSSSQKNDRPHPLYVPNGKRAPAASGGAVCITALHRQHPQCTTQRN